jgi:hypothetical protein
MKIMSMRIPSNLIFSDPRLSITFEEGVYYNKTAETIVFRGSRTGFLTLSNALIYLLNDLVEQIHLCDLFFVQCDVVFVIVVDDSIDDTRNGGIARTDAKGFIWRISEDNLGKFASFVHSLGHQNTELHLDEGKTVDEISIYCVVE